MVPPPLLCIARKCVCPLLIKCVTSHLNAGLSRACIACLELGIWMEVRCARDLQASELTGLSCAITACKGALDLHGGALRAGPAGI